MPKHRPLELGQRSLPSNAYHRRHAHNYYVMGTRRAAEGAHEEARRLLTQSLHYDPSQVSALYALAQLELTVANTALARTYIDRLIAISPDDADAYVLLGAIALHELQPEQALQAFLKAAACGVDTPELHFNTGLAHLALGHGEDAAIIFQELLAKDAENARAWDALGCARCLIPDHASAFQAFMQALHIDPKLNDTRDHLAQLFLETGNNERARQILEAALSIEPHRPDSLHLLGMAFARLEDFPQAIACWQQLLTQGIAAVETYHLLATAYLHLNDLPNARQTLELLVNRFPAVASGHLQLSLLLFNSGEAEQACHHLEQSRQLDPHNPALRAAEALAVLHPANSKNEED